MEAFWLSGGPVVAAMNTSIWDMQDGLKKLVRVDPENPDVALSDVLS